MTTRSPQLPYAVMPSTRAEAKARGKTHYFLGTPCKHGHVAPRYACDKSCVECKALPGARERSKQRSRKWHAGNRKLANAMRRKWYYENREHSLSAMRQWDQDNKDQKRLIRKRRRASRNVDHIVSLSSGGSDAIRNIQFLCAHCNKSKRAMDPIDFMQTHGFLL